MIRMNLSRTFVVSNFLSFLMALALLLCASVGSASVVYDLAADWSDTVNPNGPWSYIGLDGLPLAVHRPDWDSQTRIEHFSSPQPAWSEINASRAVPMAFKSLGVTGGTIWNLDAPVGRVGLHSNPLFTGITWASPLTGDADISGGVWKMRKNNTRIIDWRMLVNGSIVTEGTLTDADPFTSSNPFDLANGTGGSSALSVFVNAGDVIGIEFGLSGDFVGVDFAVSVIPVPEPSTVTLAALGLLGMAWRRRKQA